MVYVGIDYDCVEWWVYWIEVIKGVIVCVKYDGSEMEVIVDSKEVVSLEGKKKEKCFCYVNLLLDKEE